MATQNSPKQAQVRIGITGSYGGMNLGDEAILTSILAQIKQSFQNPKITVFSRKPEDTQKRHHVDRVVPVREASREEIVPEIKSLDVLIFGGGGILFDGEVQIFLREVQLAHEFGIPVMVYAISAGPLKETSHHPLIREALNRAAVITVRDRKARHLLEEIGVQKEIIVTADPALLLEPEPISQEVLKTEGIEKGRLLVAMSVREPGLAAPDLEEEKYHSILANVADFMVDRFDAHIVFIPMERAVQDLQHSHAVVARMLRPQRTLILKGNYTSGQILFLMKHFQLAVGMRLHFLIFAALQNLPFVALPYASKVHGLLEQFGMEMPPLDKVNAGRLIAHIDRLWDQRKSLTKQINEALPESKQKARQTHELLVQLVQGKLGMDKVPSGEIAAA